LSDEPWRPRAARRAGSLPTHGRDERLPGRQAHVEGNSSRDTSLSDDGSGASDGAGEVTFDENTSEHVDGTHDGVMLQSGPMVVSHGERVARDGGQERGDELTADREGDGGSVVGDPETSVEAEDTGAPALSGGSLGVGPSGYGVGNTQRDHRDFLSDDPRNFKGTLKPTFKGEKETIGVSPRRELGGRRGGSFSGADYLKRQNSRAENRRLRTEVSRETPVELVCPLIARPPPAAAGIPGTAGGEGQARALAAGNAMPSTLDARVVRPGNEGWPDAWNPVALLRLFPSVDADGFGTDSVELGGPRSSGRVGASTKGLDAFDALAARLAPGPVVDGADEEDAEARKSESENAADADAEEEAEGTSPRKGGEKESAPEEATAEALGEGETLEGEGEVPPARATRAATRSRAAARAAKEKEARKSGRAEKKKRVSVPEKVAPSAVPNPRGPSRGKDKGKEKGLSKDSKDSKDREKRGGSVPAEARPGAPSTDADDTASIHSGGSMSGAKAAERARRSPRTPKHFRSPERSLTALRVDLEGGYVAFIVSHELLPEDVRRSVANDEEAKEEARGNVGGEKRDDRPGAESGKSRDSERDSALGSVHAGGGGSDSNASGASDDTKELASLGETRESDGRPKRGRRESRSDGGGRNRNRVERESRAERESRRRLWVLLLAPSPALGHRAERPDGDAARLGVADTRARAGRAADAGNPAAQALQAPASSPRRRFL
jgi:hypothetical protein